jgi:hypothetical protein
MGTELTTGHFGLSLTPQERDRHRAWIGLRVEAMLDGYWQSSPPALVKAEILKDWMSALEWFTQDEITAACRKWDGGRKPRTHDIRDLIMAERGRHVKPKPPEPRKTITPEEMEHRRKVAAEVLRKFTEGKTVD